MANKPLDLTKPLQTSDGRSAKFVGRVRGDNPLVFSIDNGHYDSVITRNEFGFIHGTPDTIVRIINTPPPKRVIYLNFYSRENNAFNSVEVGGSYKTKQDADNWAQPNRIACIRLEVEEGRFDE